MKRVARESLYFYILVLFGVGQVVPATAQTRSTEPLDGFTADASSLERRIEDQFRATPSPPNAREELRRLTSEAHIAGSPEDYATAIYVRDLMRSFGLNSEIKEYQVLLSFPRAPGILELVGSRRERLQVRENV